MSPVKVAFINPSGEIGGAERALLLLLGQLDRTRYSPSVVCLGTGRFVEVLSQSGIPVEVLSLGAAERLSRMGRSSVGEQFAGACEMGRAAARLVRQLRMLRPDLIHTNGIKAHLVGGIAGRLLRRPVLWHMRDLIAEGRMRRMFRAAAGVVPQRVVGVSALVTAQFAGTQAEHRAHTVHDAVDLERYRPVRLAADVRGEFGFPPGTVVLAMVAHFTRWKGHLLFLEMLAQLLEQKLPVAGVIVGSSIYRNAAEQNYEAEVRTRAEQLGLGHRVRFTGYQDCVADFLNAADILVHPPIRPEPFGLGVIEAMALGKPVVAAAEGGMLETVAPGETGLLVPAGDVGALARAVRSLVEDPRRRETMGRNGRERVIRLFTPGVHFARIDRIYREMVSLS